MHEFRCSRVTEHFCLPRTQRCRFGVESLARFLGRELHCYGLRQSSGVFVEDQYNFLKNKAEHVTQSNPARHIPEPGLGLPVRNLGYTRAIRGLTFLERITGGK